MNTTVKYPLSNTNEYFVWSYFFGTGSEIEANNEVQVLFIDKKKRKGVT